MVTGARQTGKTTLLTGLFPDYQYVSLDLPAEARLAEEDSQTFLARHPPPLLVDEVQYAPKLFRYLKVEIDRNRNANGRYILAGSQKLNLMREVDFVIERDGCLTLAEGKWKEIPAAKDFEQATAVHELLPRTRWPVMVFCRTRQSHPLAKNTLAVDGFRLREHI